MISSRTRNMVLLAGLVLLGCDKAPATAKVAAGDLEQRKQELLHGAFTPSILPAQDLVAKAMELEQKQEYEPAVRAWAMAQKALKAATRTGDFTEFEQRQPVPLPDLLSLDLGRALFQAATAGKEERPLLLEQAEKTLQVFHEAAANRRDASTPGSCLLSTRSQDPAVLAAMETCVKLLGAIQARNAATLSAWPEQHIIEEIPLATKAMGPIRARLLSPTAKRKEAKGPKYLGVYFGVEAKPRYLVFLTAQAINWNRAGLTPQERAEQAGTRVLNLTEATAPSPDNPRGLVASLSVFWTLNSGNVWGYNLYKEGVGFTWGGD